MAEGNVQSGRVGRILYAVAAFGRYFAFHAAVRFAESTCSRAGITAEPERMEAEFAVLAGRHPGYSVQRIFDSVLCFEQYRLGNNVLPSDAAFSAGHNELRGGLGGRVRIVRFIGFSAFVGVHRKERRRSSFAGGADLG